MITLKDINLEVKKGEFIIIIGKIGSGKSSLLHAILNEMTYLPEDVMEQYGGKYSYLTEDEVKSTRKTIYKPDAKFEGGAPIKVAGELGYVEQSAWIQNMTVRDNILFGLPFDKKRYVQTVTGCQLESDLAMMVAGDMSEIGQRGINLSGG